MGETAVWQVLAYQVAFCSITKLQVRYSGATRTFVQQRMRAALLQQLVAGTRAISAAAAAQLQAAQRGVREAPRPGDAGAAAALKVAMQMADIADTLQVSKSICYNGGQDMMMTMQCTRHSRAMSLCCCAPPLFAARWIEDGKVYSRNGSLPAHHSFTYLSTSTPDAPFAACMRAAPPLWPQFICTQAAAVCGAVEGEEDASHSAAASDASGSAADPGAASGSGGGGGGGAPERPSRPGRTSDAAAAALVVASAAPDAAPTALALASGVGAGGGRGVGPPLQAWLAVCVRLCSTHSPLRTAQLELPAKDPQYVMAINEVRGSSALLPLV
jgi:hypothetical protein